MASRFRFARCADGLACADGVWSALHVDGVGQDLEIPKLLSETSLHAAVVRVRRQGGTDAQGDDKMSTFECFIRGARLPWNVESDPTPA